MSVIIGRRPIHTHDVPSTPGEMELVRMGGQKLTQLSVGSPHIVLTYGKLLSLLLFGLISHHPVKFWRNETNNSDYDKLQGRPNYDPLRN